MDWGNETYVKLYTRDTMTWKRLRWQGQTLLMHLLRRVDRSGTLDGINEVSSDLAIMTSLPDEVVKEGVVNCLREGVICVGDGVVVLPNFIDAQETPKTDRQRQAESRKRRREKSVQKSSVSQNVTGESRNVTRESQNVTDSHTLSHAVTDCHDVSLLAKLSYPKLSYPELSKAKQTQPPKGGDTDSNAVTAVTPVTGNVTPVTNVTVTRNGVHDMTGQDITVRTGQDKQKQTHPPNPPEGGDSEFDRFWEAYPKKTGKIKARKAFDKAKKNTTLSAMLEAIEKQRGSDNWTKDSGQFIPNPATWLNEGRWDDEIEVPLQRRSNLQKMELPDWRRA